MDWHRKSAALLAQVAKFIEVVGIAQVAEFIEIIFGRVKGGAITVSGVKVGHVGDKFSEL